MADVRLVVANELEIVRRGQIHIDQRIFFVGDSSQIEAAVKADENSGIKSIGKSGWRKGVLTLAARFADDIFGDIDRHIGCDRQGDRIAGPAVDFDEFTVLANAQLREIGVLP